jgi:hypothetical protein
MKVIKSVLEEELANSLAMKKDYERELAKRGITESCGWMC